MKNNCLNCSNRVGESHCTMFKDMKLAMYKQCDGFTQVPEKRKVESLSYDEVARMRIRLESKSNKGMDDSNFGNSFLTFLKNGGHWSIPSLNSKENENKKN